MGAEGRIPLHIAEEGVKLAESWVVPLVAPGEAPILEMNFLSSQDCNAARKRLILRRLKILLFLSRAR